MCDEDELFFGLFVFLIGYLGCFWGSDGCLMVLGIVLKLSEEFDEFVFFFSGCVCLSTYYVDLVLQSYIGIDIPRYYRLRKVVVVFDVPI